MADRVIRAAGGVVWRPTDANATELEVAIVHRPRYQDWSIPKGKLAPGETDIEAAAREVFEETGYRVRIGRPLGRVDYFKTSGGMQRPKVVHYWAMRADGGAFTPTPEIDGLLWLEPKQAFERVTRDSDRTVLDRFMAGPVHTRTVLVVRHGSAGNRSRWKGDDRVRPLDEVGFEQAEQLVRVLSRFGVEKIVSADFLRCTQTVEPLSEAIGVPLEEEPLLSELDYAGNEDEAVKLVRSQGRPDGAVVLCSQGDVIPNLIWRLADADGLELPPDAEYRKGSVWALHFDGEQLGDAEYIPPPPVEDRI